MTWLNPSDLDAGGSAGIGIKPIKALQRFDNIDCLVQFLEEIKIARREILSNS
jgi:hypothetical protein